MDGLRALACISVMTVHTWQIGPAGQAQFGSAWRFVEPVATIGLVLFFTLSGFLLYRPFAAALVDGADRPRAGAYLRNRALRILPAYWVILLVAALLSAVAQPGNQNAAGTLHGADATVLNVLLAQSYTPHTNLTGIPPAWSLSVEVVFYLALPLLVMGAAVLAARGRGRRARALALLVPAGVLVILGLVGKVIDHRLLGFSTEPATWGYVFQNSFVAKADLFAWGMVAAVIVSALHHERLARLPRRAIGGAGVVLIVLSDLGNQTPLAALGCGLVVLWVCASYASGAPPARNPARALETRAVVFVGLVSYSVYLWHWPVVLWLRSHGLTARGWAGVFVNLALVSAITLALSALTYRLVELPAMRLKARRRGAGAGEQPVAPQPAVSEAAP